jgi:hypothetical protein
MTVARTTLSGATSLAADLSKSTWKVLSDGLFLRTSNYGARIQASKQQTFSVLNRQGSVASIESRDQYPILA